MVCDLLDIKCLYVNEIVGSTLLAVVFAVIIYFIVASKLRFGYDSTIALSVPFALIVGLAIAEFSAIYAFATLAVAILIAWMVNNIIGNK